jgi:pimeloyl-ACP methyl ester carboxylesterase
VSRVDVLSGSTPPTVGDEPPAMQRLLANMAARTPRLLGGLFGGQAWIAANLSPSPFLSQYTDREIETFDQRVVDLLTAEFVAAVGGAGNGVATEFRLLAREWGFQVEAVDRPVRFWHGEQDVNVPLAGVQQLSQRLPNSELTTISEGDHLSTLLDCRERVVELQSQ